MIHVMKLNSEEFDNVKHNNKIIEVRLYDEKRRKIKIKDEIIFYRRPELTRSICVSVKKICLFSSFKELYNSFPSSYFGYNNLSIKEMLHKIYNIYSSKQEKENGVVAIIFEVKSLK